MARTGASTVFRFEAFGTGVVFVGYGISAPQKGYDEYSGLDVRNKLVLFAVETPRRFEESLKDEAQLQARIDAARGHGARGVLTFRSDGQVAGSFFRGALRKESYRPDFVASRSSQVVDFISVAEGKPAVFSSRRADRQTHA
jgi:hypothetical protein